MGSRISPSNHCYHKKIFVLRAKFKPKLVAVYQSCDDRKSRDRFKAPHIGSMPGDIARPRDLKPDGRC